MTDNLTIDSPNTSPGTLEAWTDETPHMLVCTFFTGTSNRGVVRTLDVFELAEILTAEPTESESKTGSPAVCFADCENGHRSNATIKSCCAFGFDFDHAPVGTLDLVGTLYQWCKQRGVGGSIYTTYSHTPEKPKARLVLIAQQALKPADYRRARKRIQKQLLASGLRADVTDDPARLFFYGRVKPGGREHWQAKSIAGGLVGTPFFTGPAAIPEGERYPAIRTALARAKHEGEDLDAVYVAMCAQCDPPVDPAEPKMQKLLQWFKDLPAKLPQDGREGMDRFTDTALAERVREQNLELAACDVSGNGYVFDREIGWTTSTRWADVCYRIAQSTLCNLANEIRGWDTPSVRLIERLESHKLTHTVASRTALDPKWRVHGWDDTPGLLGTPGGVVDLGTGVLMPWAPGHLITARTRVTPAAGPTPRWEAFLAEVLPDASVRDFVYRLLGSALWGEPNDQIVPLFQGPAATGKSTIFRTLLWLLGDYAGDVEPEHFILHRFGGTPRERIGAQLIGKRLVYVSELPQGAKLDEAKLKAFSGGSVIPTRRLYQEQVNQKLTCVLFFDSNFVPAIDGRDSGTARRILRVPMEVVIPPARRDPLLVNALQAEGPAILHKLIIGCLEWYKNGGLRPPVVVTEATAEYIAEQASEDRIKAWAEAECELQPEALTPPADLLQNYKNWCVAQGIRPKYHRQTELSDAILSEFPQLSRGRGRVLKGIALRPSPAKARFG